MMRMVAETTMTEAEMYEKVEVITRHLMTSFPTSRIPKKYYMRLRIQGMRI
jgi:hypothetical protein